MSGKRRTIQQQLAFDSVRELGCHATAEQVYEHVVRKYPSISKATVYRNLSQMAAAGELLNIGSIDGSCHYDHNCHDHYHLLCEKCKRVFDVDDYFPDIIDRVQNPEGFVIKSHNITFSGLCAECKEE